MYVQRKSLVSAVCACTVVLSFACGVLLDCQSSVLASGVDPVFMAQNALSFRERFETGFQQAETAILTDIKNGNLDASSALAKEYLTAMAIQSMCLNSPTFNAIYRSADLVIDGLPSEYFDNPSQLTIIGTCTAGYYYYNDELKTGYIYEPSSPGSFVLFTSPDMTITLIPSNATVDWGIYSHSSGSAYWDYGFGVLAPSISIEVDSSSNLQSDFTIASRVAVRSRIKSPLTSSNPPIWSSGSFITDPNVSNPSQDLIGLSIGASLPNATIDSDDPIQYYNDTALPYIRQTFPTIPDRYIVFPNGYDPSVLPTDPPEPTSPTGDFILPPYGELMTEPSSWFVTDESGETITDESGEPVTETTMIPVTVASSEEGRYVFRIPTLPNLEVPETPELSLSLPQKLVGLSAALFRGVYEILDSSGVLTILPFLVAVAVAIYVIYHIGG